jgi:hypothetical protein
MPHEQKVLDDNNKEEAFEAKVWTSQTSAQNQGSCQMGDENIQPQFAPLESLPTTQQSNIVPLQLDEFKSKSQYGEEFSFEDTHEEEDSANYKD